MSFTTLSHGNVSWTNIVHPEPQDLDQLAALYPQFHPLNLRDCLTLLEIPKLDHYDNYLFLVIHMPFWDKDLQISRRAEVDIFISKGVLVTSHRGELKLIDEIFTRLQTDTSEQAERIEQGASPLLYYLLDQLVDDCRPIVHKVEQNIQKIELSIFQTNTRYLLHEIALVRRDVIALRGILKPQLEIFDQLIKGTWPFIHTDLDPYWSDIRDHLSQLCITLDEYAEVISGLSDTADTLASHRIDEVIRLLTVVTVITMPVTVLSTLFGMNIVMPYAEYPHLFYVVTILGIVFAGFLLWFLNRKRWF
jgi:magnesium transporter